jgi:peptidylprolyl isomerase
LGACGKDDPSTSPTATPTAAASSATPSASPSAAPVKASNNFDKVTVKGKFGKSPTVTVKDPWAIDKTRTKVLQKSDGPAIQAGSTVEVNYFGVDGRTGKKFDDSFSRGAPVSFPLDQVVPGFSKGLLGQRLGSRVLIAMPGSDGYDASGGNAEAGINVGDTLIFVVDVVGVPLTGPKGDEVKPKKGLPTVTDKGGKPSISVPKTKPPTSLQVQPLIKGKGKAVGPGDTITFNYRWVKWSDGKVLEESYSAKPANAPLSGLLPGMQKGLAKQTVGSRVLLVIPPADGYPDGNADPKIDKDETLVMVVDLLYTTASA